MLGGMVAIIYTLASGYAPLDGRCFSGAATPQQQ
jgi:hypothetical protein